MDVVIIMAVPKMEVVCTPDLRKRKRGKDE
jgi:hypothetical protein